MAEDVGAPLPAPAQGGAPGSEEIFRLLVERVRDYAIFLIDPEGRVASWNAGAERIKGYAADQIVGRPYATFFTAEDRARALAEAERGRDEAERARASLQTFLGVVAHDLRGPLTAILGNAQLARRRAGAGASGRLDEALAAIVAEGRRMAELIGHLVDAARVGAGQLELRPEPTDLVALARRAVAAWQVATASHRLVLAAPERLDGTWDPGRLAEVLDNLLGNAIKYSPEGGEVRVRMERQDNQAIVSVTDQGIGLRPEELPRLFQLFTRLETAHPIEGSGLGLYIAWGIVAAHGGRIWAASPGPGQGATFAVALPL